MRDRHRDRRRSALNWVSLLLIVAMLTPVFSAFAEDFDEETMSDVAYEMIEEVAEDSAYTSDDEWTAAEAEAEIVEEVESFDIGEVSREADVDVRRVDTYDTADQNEEPAGQTANADNGDFRADPTDDAGSDVPAADAQGEAANEGPATDENAEDASWDDDSVNLLDLDDVAIIGFELNKDSFELTSKPDLDVALDYLAETVRVRAVLSNGEKAKVSVAWRCDDESLYERSDFGAFTFTGTLEDSAVEISDGVQMPFVTLYVVYISAIREPGKTEYTVEGKPTNKAADVAAAMGWPTELTAVVEGKHTEEVSIPVTWACAEYDGSESGEFLFTAQLNSDTDYMLSESVSQPAMLLDVEEEDYGFEYAENDNGTVDLYVTGNKSKNIQLVSKKKIQYGSAVTDEDGEVIEEAKTYTLPGNVSSIVVEHGAELSIMCDFTLTKNIIVEDGAVLNIGEVPEIDEDESTIAIKTSFRNYGTVEVEGKGIINNNSRFYNGHADKARGGTIVVDGFFYNYGEVYSCYSRSRISPSPDAIIYKSTKENIHYSTPDGSGNTDYIADAVGDGYYSYDGVPYDYTWRVRETHYWSQDGTCKYCGMRRIELDIHIDGEELNKYYDGKSYVTLEGGTFTSDEPTDGFFTVSNIREGDTVTIDKVTATYHYAKLADYNSDETNNELFTNSLASIATSNTTAEAYTTWQSSGDSASMQGVDRGHWWVYFSVYDEDVKYDSTDYVYVYNWRRHDPIPGIIYPRDINDSGITVKEIENQTYDDGKAIEPDVDVRSTYDNGKLTRADEDTGLGDYSVTYANNKKATRKAQAIITGIGNYTGTRTETFRIKKDSSGGGSSSSEEDDEEEKTEEENKPKPNELTFTTIDGTERLINLGYAVFDDYSRPYPATGTPTVVEATQTEAADVGLDEFEEEPEDTLPDDTYYRLTVRPEPEKDVVTGLPATLTEDLSRMKYPLVHLRLSPAQIDTLRQEHFTEVVYVVDNAELRISLSDLADQIDVAPIRRAQELARRGGSTEDEEWGAGENADSDDDEDFGDEVEGEEEIVTDNDLMDDALLDEDFEENLDSVDGGELRPEMINVTNYVFTIDQMESAKYNPRELKAMEHKQALLPAYRVAADVYNMMLPVNVPEDTTDSSDSDDDDDEFIDSTYEDTATSEYLVAPPMPVGYPVLSELTDVQFRVNGTIDMVAVNNALTAIGVDVAEEGEDLGEETLDEESADEAMDDDFEDVPDDTVAPVAATPAALPERVRSMVVLSDELVLEDNAVSTFDPEYVTDPLTFQSYARFKPVSNGMYAVVLNLATEGVEEKDSEQKNDEGDYYAYIRDIPEGGTQYWLFDTSDKTVEYYGEDTDTYMTGDYTGTIAGGAEITWESGEAAELSLKFEDDYDFAELTPVSDDESEGEAILLTLADEVDDVIMLIDEHRA